MSGPPHADTSASPPAIPDHELIRRIGDGAYGEVWLARNVFGELRAVKIIHRSRFSDPRPFEREFEGIQRFEPISRSHPSQLAILHVGRNEAAGCFYYVMELADAVERQKDEGRRQKSGESTECPPDSVTSSFSLLTSALPYVPRTLRHDLEQQSRLPARRVLELGLALAEALAHLHSHGLVHRDIKPSNLIFVNGRPKLADIGLVTDASDQCSIVGTEGYLAPEGPGAPPADIFALGKVLYEALTGLDRRRYPEMPAEIRDWPDHALVFELNEIILKACAADVHQRYADADAMLADLRHLSEGRSVKRQRAWQQTRRLTLQVGVAAAAITAAWLLFNRFNASSPQLSTASTPAASIFVLPFRNDGTNQVNELRRSRITDAIIDGLAKIDGIKVGPRKSGWVRRDEKEAWREAAKLFRSRYAVSGSVRASANELAVLVTLRDIASDRVLWTESFSSTRAEQVELERRVIHRVTEALGLKVSPEATQGIDRVLTNNLRALELFRQAPSELIITREKYSRKVEFLRQAISTDGQFAKAYESLAHARVFVSDWQLRPGEVMPDAKAEAQRALELDDTLVDAHRALGQIGFQFEWNFAEAETHYRRAIELDPAALWPRWNYATLLRAVGKVQEARRECETLERFHPRTAPNYFGEQLYWEARFPEILPLVAKLLETEADDGHLFYLGEIYLWNGLLEKSLGAFQKSLKLFNGPEYLCRVGYVHARLGNREKAMETLQYVRDLGQASLVYVSPYSLATLVVGLGDKDECFRLLNEAVEHRSAGLVGGGLTALASDPCWDPLRDDPRFAQLLDQVGLPPAAKELALRKKLAR